MHASSQGLQTARLLLRPPIESDAEAIHAALRDWDVVRWLSRAPHPYRLSDAEDFISRNAENVGRVWLVEFEGRICGCVGCKDEFGYWFAREVWGRGFATEAGSAVLRSYFRKGTREPLLSGHFPGNMRSRRVLEKLGFQAYEDRTIFAQALGRTTTIIGMRMTAEDYRKALLRRKGNSQ